MPAGTSFLDARRGTTTLPVSIQRKLIQKGCRLQSMTMEGLFNVRSHVTKLQCWSVYTELTQALGIAVIAKSFYAFAPSYCANHNTAITDFIGIDMSAMNDYAVFTSEIPQPNDILAEERLFIRDYINQAKASVTAAPVAWADRFNGVSQGVTMQNYFATSAKRFPTPWPALKTAPINVKIFKEMVLNRIFGCNNDPEEIP